MGQPARNKSSFSLRWLMLVLASLLMLGEEA
jgi:hypothetical protein